MLADANIGLFIYSLTYIPAFLVEFTFIIIQQFLPYEGIIMKLRQKAMLFITVSQKN